MYGEPRRTRDNDLTPGATPEELPHVLNIASQLALRVLVENSEDFAQHTRVLPALDPESGLRVDFIFSWTPYEQQALQRTRTFFIENHPVRFAAPEDMIIHNILTGRPRDLEDVRSSLRKQDVDVAYIRSWFKQFEQAWGKPFVETFEHILHEEVSDGDA
jgi:hypothetical protein